MGLSLGIAWEKEGDSLQDSILRGKATQDRGVHVEVGQH